MLLLRKSFSSSYATVSQNKMTLLSVNAMQNQIFYSETTVLVSVFLASAHLLLTRQTMMHLIYLQLQHSGDR